MRERREPPTTGDREQGPPQITGYAVTNMVEVTVRDLDQMGELIAAAVEAGGDAARVQRLDLLVEDDAAQLEEARRAAFADARERAEQYADQAGRSLGELISVSEVVGPGPVPAASATEAAADTAAPPIEPGQQQVGVRIQATWAFD